MTKLFFGSIIVLSVAASACVVEVDVPSITLERRCDRTADCTFKGVADEHLATIPLELMNGSTAIPIDLQSDGVIAPHYGKSVLALDGWFTLDAVEVIPLDDMSFDGVESLSFKRQDGVTIAAYQRDSVGTMDGHEVMLDGNTDVNLLELGASFTIELEGAGTLPAQDWMASLVFHVHANARAH